MALFARGHLLITALTLTGVVEDARFVRIDPVIVVAAQRPCAGSVYTRMFGDVRDGWMPPRVEPP